MIVRKMVARGGRGIPGSIVVALPVEMVTPEASAGACTKVGGKTLMGKGLSCNQKGKGQI